MGTLLANLQLQHNRLSEIAERLDEIDPAHKENIDLAIEELEEEISNAVDALDRMDNGMEDEEDEEEDEDCEDDEER